MGDDVGKRMWMETLRKAEKGDKDALRDVPGRYEGDPKRLVLDNHGDLPRLVENIVTGEMLKSNRVAVHAARARTAEIRAELEGPASTPLERLLCERIALTWLDLYASPERGTWRSQEHHERRFDRAHRRYLSALKALATVRKLNLTAIQVNVGRT